MNCRLPVVLFGYNRPQHLARCLMDLRANPESTSSFLRIYVDGPRNEYDVKMRRQIEEVTRRVVGFATVDVVLRQENLGLSQSVLTGVSEMIQEFGEVIVIEDDLRLSPHFLRYMKDALSLYRDQDQVYSVHAYTYPIKEKLPETFFLRGADCWGWATWARAWKNFEPDPVKLLHRLKTQGLSRAFDLDGAYPYMQMLRDNAQGKNDSWAVRWHATAFLAEALTLYSGKSLVWNSGLDGTGTHSGDLQLHSPNLATSPVAVDPVPIEESKWITPLFAKYLRSMQRRRRLKRITSVIQRRKCQLD